MPDFKALRGAVDTPFAGSAEDNRIAELWLRDGPALLAHVASLEARNAELEAGLKVIEAMDSEKGGPYMGDRSTAGPIAAFARALLTKPEKETSDG